MYILHDVIGNLSTLKGIIPSIVVFLFKSLFSRELLFIVKLEIWYVILGLLWHFIYVICNSFFTSQRAIIIFYNCIAKPNNALLVCFKATMKKHFAQQILHLHG